MVIICYHNCNIYYQIHVPTNNIRLRLIIVNPKRYLLSLRVCSTNLVEIQNTIEYLRILYLRSNKQSRHSWQVNNNINNIIIIYK